MIVLSTIATIKPKEIYGKLDHIAPALNKGTLIPQDWDTKAIGKIVAPSKT
jgi:hypothetical protein